MARVQNTLIGKSSGSVGGATFSTWKGINVLKSKALVVANPRTVKQQTQRNRMTAIVALFRLLAGIINVGFKAQAIGKSSYNAFVSTNILPAYPIDVAPAVSFSPTDLLLSKGTMGATPIDSVTGTNASANVVVTWNDALVPIGSTPTDLAYLAVYNEDQDAWGFPAAPALRSAGTITAIMPANVVTGNSLIAYLFFKSSSSDEVSDSEQGYDTP